MFVRVLACVLTRATPAAYPPYNAAAGRAKALLQSYETERRPIAVSNAALSVRNYERTLNVARCLGLDANHPKFIAGFMKSDFLGGNFGMGLKKVRHMRARVRACMRVCVAFVSFPHTISYNNFFLFIVLFLSPPAHITSCAHAITHNANII